MKLFTNLKGIKTKKGLMTALVSSVLVVAMAVPVLASYTPNWEQSYSSTKYEGHRVQVAKFTTSMYQNVSPYYKPLYPDIMQMNAGEALVDSYTTQYFDPTYGSFRMGIAGKVGSGMMEGWVIDNHFSVVTTMSMTVKTRVELTAWTNPTGTATTGPNIPAGATLCTADNQLYAYADGSRVRINGYWYGGTWYASNSYINTNWSSGSVSSYYVQIVQ